MGLPMAAGLGAERGFGVMGAPHGSGVRGLSRDLGQWGQGAEQGYGSPPWQWGQGLSGDLGRWEPPPWQRLHWMCFHSVGSYNQHVKYVKIYSVLFIFFRYCRFKPMLLWCQVTGFPSPSPLYLRLVLFGRKPMLFFFALNS